MASVSHDASNIASSSAPISSFFAFIALATRSIISLGAGIV
jgi:hypothetical protein